MYVCVVLLWVMYGYYRVTVYKCSLTRVYGRVHVCVTCMYLWLLWRCVPVCVCRYTIASEFERGSRRERKRQNL